LSRDVARDSVRATSCLTLHLVRLVFSCGKGTMFIHYARSQLNITYITS